MKSYSDIEQSKKLAEMLPIESADMYWQYIEEDNGQLQWFCFPKDFSINQHNTVPAWSLSALLELIPTSIDEYTKDFSQLEITKCSVSYVYAMCNLRKGCLKDNLLDAAFEMVCWLKENNKL